MLQMSLFKMGRIKNRPRGTSTNDHRESALTPTWRADERATAQNSRFVLVIEGGKFLDARTAEPKDIIKKARKARCCFSHFRSGTLASKPPCFFIMFFIMFFILRELLECFRRQRHQPKIRALRSSDTPR